MCIANSARHFMHFVQQRNRTIFSKYFFHSFQSILGIGAIAGALIGGWAIEYFGRKTALMVYSVPFATGWLLISNAKHGWMLFLGRILTGIAVGSTSLTVPVSTTSSLLYFCHSK